MKKKFEKICDWLASLYVNTLNVIHYMHDKYCYEKLQMALHDDEVFRTMACGEPSTPARSRSGLMVLFQMSSLNSPKYWQVVSLANKKKLAEGYLELLQKLESDVDKMIAEGVATKADGVNSPKMQ